SRRALAVRGYASRRPGQASVTIRRSSSRTHGIAMASLRWGGEASRDGLAARLVCDPAARAPCARQLRGGGRHLDAPRAVAPRAARGACRSGGFRAAGELVLG